MSSSILLTADEDLPDVRRAPAPWTLDGDGWILLLRLPEDVRQDARHLPPELRDQALLGPSIVMFVDYADSPAGPYRELLYIPGRCETADGRRAWTVTRIYVSSWDSVVNGRQNWGIPKDLAEFERTSTGRGERIRVAVGNRQIASLELESRGPALPVHAGLLPGGLRRIVQYHAGRSFEFTPVARGRAALARAGRLETDTGLFPDLAGGRLALALRVPRFRLHFPAPTAAGVE